MKMTRNLYEDSELKWAFSVLVPYSGLNREKKKQNINTMHSSLE